MNELPVARPLSFFTMHSGYAKGQTRCYEQERLCGFYGLSTFTAFNRIRNEVMKNSTNEDSNNA